MKKETIEDLKFMGRLYLHEVLYDVPFDKRDQKLALSTKIEREGKVLGKKSRAEKKASLEPQKGAFRNILRILKKGSMGLVFFPILFLLLWLMIPGDINLLQMDIISKPGVYLLTVPLYLTALCIFAFTFMFMDTGLIFADFYSLLAGSPMPRRNIALFSELMSYIPHLLSSLFLTALFIFFLPKMPNPYLTSVLLFAAIFLVSVIFFKGYSLLRHLLEFPRTRRGYKLLKRIYDVFILLLFSPILKMFYDVYYYGNLDTVLHLYITNPLTMLLMLPVNTVIFMVSPNVPVPELAALWVLVIVLAFLAGYLRFVQERILISESWKERYHFHMWDEIIKGKDKVNREEIKYFRGWDPVEASGVEVLERIPKKRFLHSYSKDPFWETAYYISIFFSVCLVLLLIAGIPLYFLLYMLLAIPLYLYGLADIQRSLLTSENELTWVRLIPIKPEVAAEKFQRSMDRLTISCGFLAGVFLVLPVMVHYAILHDPLALYLIIYALLCGVHFALGYNTFANISISTSMKFQVSPLKAFSTMAHVLPMFADMKPSGFKFYLKYLKASFLFTMFLLILMVTTLNFPSMWIMIPEIFNIWLIAGNLIVLVALFFVGRYTFQNNMIKLLTHNRRNRDEKVRVTLYGLAFSIVLGISMLFTGFCLGFPSG